MPDEGAHLTVAEARAIYDLIDSLSGGNPENFFTWDGSDTLEDAATRAMVKVFRCAGREVPTNLEVVL